MVKPRLHRRRGADSGQTAFTQRPPDDNGQTAFTPLRPRLIVVEPRLHQGAAGNGRTSCAPPRGAASRGQGAAAYLQTHTEEDTFSHLLFFVLQRP